MHALLRSLAAPLLGSLGACFPPPLGDCPDTGCPATTTLEPTTGSPTLPTGDDGDGLQTVTGDTPTTPDDDTASDPTPGDPADAPTIVAVHIDPTPIHVNGLIAVDVDVEHADRVRMQIGADKPIDLVASGPDRFRGQIPAFTGLANGSYIADLTPSRDTIVGDTVPGRYTIDLPEPGGQGLWETGDLIGGGQIAALDVMPDGTVVELGTYWPQGQPRCYLRRRDQAGAWSAEDFVPLLPASHCTAIDLEIDPTHGTLRVLVYREGNDDQRWWLGEIASWGKGPKNLGLGNIGDKAEALAQGPGMLAICGAQPTPTLDLDAAAWLFRQNQPVEPMLFDYQPDPNEDKPHRFGETARDCIFAEDVLVMVGEANGVSWTNANDIPRDRLFVLEHDTLTATRSWTVASPGPGTQSGALAVDVDDDGRYLLAGYTCGDICAPDGDIRIYRPGGKLDWQASLGPLGVDLAGPHDIAWSPAGYIVVALGQFDENGLRFKVQAFAPQVYEALWTFLPVEMQGPQVALALAIGKYGEIYAGGVGADNYPAFAIVPG